MFAASLKGGGPHPAILQVLPSASTPQILELGRRIVLSSSPSFCSASGPFPSRIGTTLDSDASDLSCTSLSRPTTTGHSSTSDSYHFEQLGVHLLQSQRHPRPVTEYRSSSVSQWLSLVLFRAPCITVACLPVALPQCRLTAELHANEPPRSLYQPTAGGLPTEALTALALGGFPTMNADLRLSSSFKNSMFD